MIRARARLQPGVWNDHSLHVDFRTHKGRQLIRLSIGPVAIELRLSAATQLISQIADKIENHAMEPQEVPRD